MPVRSIGRPLLPVLALLAACAPPADTPVPVSDTRAIPKIDFHAHYAGDAAKVVSALDAWNMRALIIGTYSDTLDHPRRWAGMRELHRQHPERFALGASFNPFTFNDPDFAEKTIALLRAEIDRGARIVKVWKNIGMELKDPQGNYVQIDHPRFQPIWDFLIERNIPVMAHLGEPIDAWQPLTQESPHYGYYRDNPQYHAYQHPEIPRHETIIAARDRWLARNPRLIVVGAHLGSLEHDVDEVAKRLDRFPNFHVETGARFNNLARQPREKVRDFLIRYQDRVMYGTDLGERAVDRMNTSYELHWRLFAGSDTVTLGSPTAWNRRLQGYALPGNVLRKLYHDNAVRILRL